MSFKQEIKSSLMGCLEIALFMRVGVDRYQDGWGPMWRSCLLAIFTIPLSFIVIGFLQEDTPELVDLSFATVASLFFAKGLIAMIISLSVLVAFAKAYDRMENVLKAITITNWTAIITIVFSGPIIAMMVYGIHTYEDVYPVFLVITIYSYFLTAFYLTFALKIPWEMAGFLTIINLAIQDTTYKATLWIASSL